MSVGARGRVRARDDRRSEAVVSVAHDTRKKVQKERGGKEGENTKSTLCVNLSSKLRPMQKNLREDYLGTH